ncbi:MAG: tetratricopeptide repeat protein [Actinobacteria bacterium]|nr:MAG: tetratricopeptide repeat protein [Actinomycetota bacterium]
MEPALGQLRTTRARLRVHRPRRHAARHLALHRGDPRGRRRRGPGRLPVARRASNLGSLLRARGETDEAEQWYRQAAEGR